MFDKTELQVVNKLFFVLQGLVEVGEQEVCKVLKLGMILNRCQNRELVKAEISTNI